VVNIRFLITGPACTSSWLKESGPEVPDIHALDIAKRLMDYDFHPPTNYFPLIVHEALMIEPTETENKQTLDAFADALLKIAEEAHTESGTIEERPTQHSSQPIGRSESRERTCAVLLVAGKRIDC